MWRILTLTLTSRKSVKLCLGKTLFIFKLLVLDVISQYPFSPYFTQYVPKLALLKLHFTQHLEVIFSNNMSELC